MQYYCEFQISGGLWNKEPGFFDTLDSAIAYLHEVTNILHCQAVIKDRDTDKIIYSNEDMLK